MAFNDLEYHSVKKEVEVFVESIRPAPHIRPELDIIFTIDDQTIEIGERRPLWRGEPGEASVLTSAKITYVRSQKRWNLYWMRGTLKWELYSAERTLGAALNLVCDDIHGCFFG